MRRLRYAVFTLYTLFSFFLYAAAATLITPAADAATYICAVYTDADAVMPCRYFSRHMPCHADTPCRLIF